MKLKENVGEYYQMSSEAFGDNWLTVRKCMSFLVLLCFLCKIPANNPEQ